MGDVVVINQTTVRQVWEGFTLPVGVPVPVPVELAIKLNSVGGYLVDFKDGADWIDDDGNFSLYFMAPFSVCDGYGSQAEDLALTWEKMGVKLTAKHLWFLNPFGLKKATLDILNRPVTTAHQVGLCYATPGEFTQLPTDYRVGLTMYESSDPRVRYPNWTYQINEVDLLLTPSEWCMQMWREASVYTPIKVIELSASHHFLEAPLWTPHDREEFVIVSWATMTPRKSPVEMIDLFKRVFPRDKYPHHQFKIKTRSNLCGSVEHDFPKHNDDRVEIINEDWTFEQMVEFARNADLGMFLSKGEGSGRPGREAMALGLPCMLADNTGYSSVCDKRFVTPIQTHHAEESPLGGEWYIPDWEQAAEELKWHHTCHEKAADRAWAGALWYREEHSLERVCSDILDAMRSVTTVPSKRSVSNARTWQGFYQDNKVTTAQMQHIQKHHRRFFEYAERTFPNGTYMAEIGIGTGAFYAGLYTRGFKTVAIEKDSAVINTALKMLQRLNIKPRIRQGDTFELDMPHVDVIYHQGLLEHFTDVEILDMLRKQFVFAPRILFSVPSIYYPTRDFGNERLLPIEHWRDLLFSLYTIVQSEYYGGDGRFHVLFDISRDQPVRGAGIKRKM